MLCEEIQERISELMDAELDDKESIPVYRHLSECQTCRSFFTSFQKMREAVQSIAYEDTHADDYGTKNEWWRNYIRVPLPAAAVFIMLFITGIIGTSMHLFQSDDPYVSGEHRIIYISEYPEIEIHLLTDRE